VAQIRIVVLLARPSPLTLSGFGTLLAVLAGVEAVARGRTRLLLLGAAAVFVWVSVVAGVVVAVLRNWQLALATSLSVIAVWLLALNLREIRSPPGRRTAAEGRRHGGTART